MSQVGILAGYLQQCLNIINISKGLVEIDHLYRAYQQIYFTLLSSFHRLMLPQTHFRGRKEKSLQVLEGNQWLW